MEYQAVDIKDTRLLKDQSLFPLLFKAFVLALSATIFTGYIAFDEKVRFYDEYWFFTILSVHFLSLFFPLISILNTYNSSKDVLDPSFIATFSFLVNHVLFNLIVLGSEELSSRNLSDINDDKFLEIVLTSYLVIIIAWCSYSIGYLACGKLIPEMSKKNKEEIPSKKSNAYLIAGLLFVIIGVFGNIGAIGGLDLYLDKIFKFYERSTIYEEIMNTGGGIKFMIAIRFLPVGLVLLAFGYCIHSNLQKKGIILVLLFFSILNVFLNNATGQRSATLAAFFYSAILINYSVKRFKFYLMVLGIFAVIILSFLLGALRDTAYLGYDLIPYLGDFIGPYTEHFVAHYMTNYLGTLTLVNEVSNSGIVHGQTAFAGATGLLGGPTPVTTQSEIWDRISQGAITSNPRYGLPGELYFNFGWSGIVVGMAITGLLVSILTQFYRRAGYEQTVFKGIFAVFAVITSWYIMIVNMSYIPPDFTYYAVPFYLIFLGFHRLKS